MSRYGLRNIAPPRAADRTAKRLVDSDGVPPLSGKSFKDVSGRRNPSNRVVPRSKKLRLFYAFLARKRDAFCMAKVADYAYNGGCGGYGEYGGYGKYGSYGGYGGYGKSIFKDERRAKR